MTGIIIVLLLLCIFLFYLYSKEKTKTKEIDKINEDIRNENKKIFQENENLLEKQKLIKSLYNQKQEEVKSINETIEKSQQISKKAFENYAEVLSKSYKEKEEEYDNLIEILENSYKSTQDKILLELDEVKTDLDNMRATRAAAQQAFLKEKEIKENKQFYCLSIKEEDLEDIKILEKIKPKLNNPRILCMLIWSTYYQKPMTALCNNILGTKEIAGIYKITNQVTDQCYIGQGVDVSRRWKEHAKYGLGIDTPQSNKLYQAIEEYGLYNFSFELIEECSREKLNEKEKYYIDLYQSYEYGYNSNKGISKK